MEGGNVSDRRGGRVSATGGDSGARRQEGTRRPGGEETRAGGQEREGTRKERRDWRVNKEMKNGKKGKRKRR